LAFSPISVATLKYCETIFLIHAESFQKYFSRNGKKKRKFRKRKIHHAENSFKELLEIYDSSTCYAFLLLLLSSSNQLEIA
jgi:hypothetical protein